MPHTNTTTRRNSAEIYADIVHPVNCKYGAPMGRKDNPPPLGTWLITPFFDRRVKMSACGAYDSGGAYWGTGATLRVRYSKDGQFWQFYRKDTPPT